MSSPVSGFAPGASGAGIGSASARATSASNAVSGSAPPKPAQATWSRAQAVKNRLSDRSNADACSCRASSGRCR